MSPVMIGTLIIICGLPGSGKTTLALQLEQTRRAIRFCPDEWMNDLAIDLYDENTRGKIETLQWKLARNLLVHGIDTIIEWGTWARSERDDLRNGARAIGGSVELHYLSAPTDILFNRIQRRAMEIPPIERSMIEQWNTLFQVPDKEEMALFDRAFAIHAEA